MTPLRYILASLRHYRRIHIAVALGVAVATAVLTGSLLVGDSVRGSLRDLTLQRLGQIDQVLVTDRLFRAALAGELAADADFKQHFAAAEPAILMPGTLGSGDGARRATRVSVIGCRDAFWSLGAGGPETALAPGEVALSESLARELGTAPDDEILLRVPAVGAIPGDSPLGEKSDTSVARRLQVAAVLADQGLARFAVRPSQHLPRNMFVPIETLQNLLEQPGRANALLVAGPATDPVPNAVASQALAAALRPRLEDYGIRVERLASPTACYQITADRLVLSDTVVEAAERVFGQRELQSVVTYLANTLKIGERQIPYSTITGVESTADLGPLLDEGGEPISVADDQIILNRWAADDLGVQIGDRVTVNFYEPESTHGRLREHQPPVTLELVRIVPLARAGEPTAAADPSLTPELPGVTDRRSIDDWDLPFELVEEIRGQDEDYWDEFRTTPKAFVSLATAERLWASRWGTTSLLRLPTGVDAPAARLERELDPEALGMTFLPVKEQGLTASSGTTPFDGLFLAFSFFLIASAVMLIALLFQLGVQQRAAELGILAAAGLRRRQISQLLAREGLIVAAIGAAVGVGTGVLYAWLMITGLRTWGIAAIGTPFLALHVTWRSLIIGWVVGVIVSWLAIRWSIRRLVGLPVGRLLAGETEQATPAACRAAGGSRRWTVVRGFLIVASVALAAAGFWLRGEAQAAAFFGCGASALVLLLGEVRNRLRAARFGAARRGPWGLASLSALNTARNPGRSTLTIGLVAAASFLIVATGAFHLDTTEQGTGGFELLATSDRPIHYDLNTPDGRRELTLTDDESRQLDSWWVYAMRVHDGEDASCLNLYRPTQPAVLGVPQALVERGGFVWSAAADRPGSHASPDTPWTLLESDLGSDEAGRPTVPVVLDMNTAIYSLRLKGVGSTLSIRDGDGRPATVEVVGLLKNSVLQGKLLMSEGNFVRLFPDSAGCQFFLIESRRSATPTNAGLPPDAATVVETLERALSDDGFDATDARDELASFYAVQNTYLLTFQTLGALGLLLGTVGLAVVQLRSVLERRGELALLRAAGFRHRRLVRMIVWETGVLLLGGLGVGLSAAVLALVPAWLSHGGGFPWATFALLLGVIALVGLLAGRLAARSALRVPLVAALRGD